MRNLVEHEFIVPNKDQVIDFIDIVALFNASTERYLYNFPGDSQIENDFIEDMFLDILINRTDNIIRTEVRRRGLDTLTFIIDPNHPDYIRFVSVYIKKFLKS